MLVGGGEFFVDAVAGRRKLVMSSRLRYMGVRVLTVYVQVIIGSKGGDSSVCRRSAQSGLGLSPKHTLFKASERICISIIE